jgi:hypothetical protein
MLFGYLLLLFIFLLVRKRKLNEEYSWLWLLTGLVIIFFAIRLDFLYFLCGILDIKAPQSLLFFFGIIFLVLINIFLSVKVSSLSNQLRSLSQKTSLLENEIADYKKKI